MSLGLGFGLPRSRPFAGGPSLNLQFAGSQSLDPRITFSRTSNATYFDQAGVLQLATYNLLRRSQEFNTAFWNVSEGTVSENAITAPDGTLSAEKFAEVSTTGVHLIVQSTINLTTPTIYTFSVFLKASERTFAFVGFNTGSMPTVFVSVNLTNGTISTATGAPNFSAITPVGNGWYRVSITATTVVSGITNVDVRVSQDGVWANRSYAGDAGSGIFIWGAQLELASSAGPYYATTDASNGAPRFDYSPTTLAPLGLLIEEARTNSIRNNTMVGAVAGTPGTLPTNWVVNSAAGLTTNVIGTGATSGITWIDVQITGTPTGTSYALSPESSNQVVAASGQSWASSSYLAISGGAITNITSIASRVRSFTSGGTGLQASAGTNIKGTLTSLLQRFSESVTLTDATTAFVNLQVLLTVTIGSAIDITLRIGLPQLENNNISTGVSTATVAAGGTGYTNGDVLTVVGGTGTAATLTVTGVSAGAITTVSVTTAGSYSVFPPSPASVTGGTGASATFNLVPVTQTGFATSVIPTTTVALTRNADNTSVASLTPWFNATEGTIAVKYRTGADLVTTRAAVFDDGGFNNTISAVGANSGGSGPTFDVFVGGVSQAGIPAGSINAANTTFTLAGAYKANDFAASRNGSVAATDTSGTLPTVTTLRLGQQLNSGYLNGWVQSFSYYPRRLSNTELQTLTA